MLFDDAGVGDYLREGDPNAAPRLHALLERLHAISDAIDVSDEAALLVDPRWHRLAALACTALAELRVLRRGGST